MEPLPLTPSAPSRTSTKQEEGRATSRVTVGGFWNSVAGSSSHGESVASYERAPSCNCTGGTIGIADSDKWSQVMPTASTGSQSPGSKRHDPAFLHLRRGYSQRHAADARWRSLCMFI